MANQSKYKEIIGMTSEDRREIHRFAMQRSREMLAGVEKRMDAPPTAKRATAARNGVIGPSKDEL